MHMLTTLAQAAPLPNPDDPTEILARVLDALAAGNWRLLAALVVIGLVWVLRRFAARIHPWFGTDRGGVVVALAGGLLAVVAGEVATGRTLTLQTALNGINLAVAAAGGWVMVKRLVSPPASGKLVSPPPSEGP